ncbi:MAG: class I mannose-6-phosphate isomerase [Phycisphaeraceae bacterium]|nr:class I mannose-6-phosphate isomerase [Phycisphaeraceae bacterium]
MTDRPLLYPLKLEPIYKEKVWGGRALEKLGRKLPGDSATAIGESWELADLATTSVSGGGGAAERSIVRNGPLAGRTLHDLMQLYGADLLGRLKPDAEGGFPVLIKFLDAGDNLSVQVHPSTAWCESHTDAYLKSEAWYILDAKPGAAIYKGIRPGVTPAQLRAAIASGTSEAVEQTLIKVPVKAGDCHYLPSGTCHALGAGVLVAEVQTPSDTTFRVFDWGRTGRQLHIEQAMECIHFGPPDVRQFEKRSHVAGMFTTVSRLVLCEHFRIEKIRMTESYEQEVPYDQPAVWIVLEGKGTITPGNGAGAVEFTRGETLLIPAHLDKARAKFDLDTTWLEVTFPQALAEPLK